MRSVTVVIPTRNRLELLQRTLRTVRGQRDVEVDVVVVDEGSDDGTAAFLAASAGPELSFVRHDRPAGVARARNAGIERARSPWVAFVDDDDLWAPGKLAAQLDALAADGEARWACVGCVVVGTDLELRRASRPPREREPADHLLSYNHVPGGGSGVLADRALVEEVGGFSTDLSTLADWDLWIRLALESPLATVDRPLLAYLEHGAGMSRSARDIRVELEVVRDRYAAERARRDRTFDDRWWLAWLAELDERSGRRASALRYHLQRARLGDRGALRDIARTARGTRAWDDADRRAALEIPADWRTEAEAWLAPLRAP